MGFGIDSGISRQTNNSVNVAEKLNNNGDVVELHTFGGKKEVQEEFYSSSFTNAAVNGQSGESVVSGHNLIESNADFAKEQKTTVTALSTTS